ncbi:hypothetical protein C8R43DRAFT_1103535 [Mycena crocata]|nr:hypothetical protein C8R43DRAFT_1103535 [Mycena crocata]
MDAAPAAPPDGFVLQGKFKDQPFRIILVTHDESTFYANARRNVGWTHKAAKGKPEPKGEGESIMVSDFLTLEWGRLVNEEDEARLFFRAGKNRDVWFNSDDVLKQVARAIDIFEAKTKGLATGLFLFDNAPSHQKRAADALSARKMVKFPKQGWTLHPDGPRMRNGTLPNGESQSFYFPDDHPTMPGWFKGMEQIVRERGLWRNGLLSQCTGFKCQAGRTDCCCRRILFCQPDFVNQKSALEEYVVSRGHICDFYPKYHSKFRYRTTAKTSNIDEMEQNVKACLDDVPKLQIIRYANRAARFISPYAQGLSGADRLIWIKKKYRSHRILPPSMVAEIKASILARKMNFFNFPKLRFGRGKVAVLCLHKGAGLSRSLSYRDEGRLDSHGGGFIGGVTAANFGSGDVTRRSGMKHRAYASMASEDSGVRVQTGSLQSTPRGQIGQLRITTWRLLNTTVFLALGIYKAISAYRGGTTTPTTLDWIIGVGWTILSYWLSIMEQENPDVAPWLFIVEWPLITTFLWIGFWKVASAMISPPITLASAIAYSNYWSRSWIVIVSWLAPLWLATTMFHTSRFQSVWYQVQEYFTARLSSRMDFLGMFRLPGRDPALTIGIGAAAGIVNVPLTNLLLLRFDEKSQALKYVLGAAFVGLSIASLFAPFIACASDGTAHLSYILSYFIRIELASGYMQGCAATRTRIWVLHRSTDTLSVATAIEPTILSAALSRSNCLLL